MSDLQTNKLYVNRFSILLAFLALGFSLLYLIPLESEAEAINIFGFIFRFDFYGLFPLILALLAGVGAYWVFSTHPRWKNEKRGVIKLLPHLALPFITTLILAVVLGQSSRSLIWWVVFLAGYLILALLLRAEYVLIQEDGDSNLLYSVLVISFSYGTFLILAIALKNSDVRMFIQMILIFLAALFVTFRGMSIRQSKKINYFQPLLVAWLIAQLGVALHYLFINPIQYGLILTGLLYAVTSWIHFYEENKKWHQYTEPLLMIFITVVILVLSSIF
ncbi:MAG: hypothetical protein GX797_03500 [Chloroflexi bacterium]|jgi:hypothetical protein|nr:hypothetical protein [Chloroflexota bacterium]